MFVIDVEAVLSLEMTLSSLTRVGGTHSDGSSYRWTSRWKRLWTASKTGRQVPFTAGKNERSRSSLCNGCTDRSPSARYLADGLRSLGGLK